MFKLHSINSVITLALIGIFVSCTKKKETPAPIVLETKTYKNLYAPQSGGQGQPVGGVFTKFSFSKNEVVSDDSWDIAFRGTTIIVNGGSAIGITDEPTRKGMGAISIVSNTLESVSTIPEINTFTQDNPNTYAIPTGSGKGWYNYNSSTNILSPIAGKVFVIKTFDGKYAKMEFLSYYKDLPANPDATSLSRYFSFKYVYQANGINF